QIELPWLTSIGRPRERHRLPVVLSRDEVGRVLAVMAGEHALLARLLYGTGMRISETLQLRVKDIDFDHRSIVVRSGKGGKDRALMLPEALAEPLRDQLRQARAAGSADRDANVPGVWLPDALERKYPRAGQDSPGRGSGCFRRVDCRATRDRALCGGIFCMRRRSSGRSSGRWPMRELPRRRRRIACDIRSPRICCSRATDRKSVV